MGEEMGEQRHEDGIGRRDEGEDDHAALRELPGGLHAGGRAALGATGGNEASFGEILVQTHAILGSARARGHHGRARGLYAPRRGRFTRMWDLTAP